MTTKQKRDLLKGVKKVCAYCGISETECRQFFEKNPSFSRGGHRGLTLEVDRINSQLPYCKCNVVWACYICNNSKSNYCNSIQEFKPIADGIRQFWKQKGYNPKP